MWEFLSNNWVWILLLGGMLLMHLGHGGHGAGGGCGGHQHSRPPRSATGQEPGEDAGMTSRRTQYHDHRSS